MEAESGDEQVALKSDDTVDTLERCVRVGAGFAAVLVGAVLLAAFGFGGFVIAETLGWITTASAGAYANMSLLDRSLQILLVTLIFIVLPSCLFPRLIHGMTTRSRGAVPSYRQRYHDLKSTLTIRTYDLGEAHLDLRRPSLFRAVRWGSPFGIRLFGTLLSLPFRSLVFHFDSGLEVWCSTYLRIRFSRGVAIQHRVAEHGIGPAILLMTAWNGWLFMLRWEALVLMHGLCAQLGLRGFRHDDPLVSIRIHLETMLALFSVLGRGHEYRQNVVAEIESAILEHRAAQGLSGAAPRPKPAVILPDSKWPISPRNKSDD